MRAIYNKVPISQYLNLRGMEMHTQMFCSYLGQGTKPPKTGFCRSNSVPYIGPFLKL